MRDIQILMQHPVDDVVLTLIQGLAEKCKNIEQDVLATANALIDDGQVCLDVERIVRDEITLVFDNIHMPNKHIPLESMRRAAKNILRRFKKLFEEPGFGEIKGLLSRLSNCNNEGGKNELMDVLCRELDKKKELPNDLGRALDGFIDKYGAVSFDYLGDYNHKNKTITIYMQNIIKHNSYQCDEHVISTFAHEVFHAYHFHLIKLLNGSMMFRLFFRRRREDNIVIESLASYFEHHFDLRHHLNNRAHEIENSWHLYSPRIYPYSGARWITDEQHFKRIVDATAMDLDLAFRILKYHI